MKCHRRYRCVHVTSLNTHIDNTTLFRVSYAVHVFGVTGPLPELGEASRHVRLLSFWRLVLTSFK